MLEMGDVFGCVLVVFGCGSMWWYVLVCVVFVVFLVASVLASMRWLLCGGDGSKGKTTSVISKKCPAREFIPITFLINAKNKTA